MAVAAATTVLAVSAIAAGVGTGALWVFEVLAGAGLLVGLGAAFGLFDRASVSLPLRSVPDPQLTPELSAAVEARLRALDPVEHRRLDLGSPWPTVVVGPTGVTVISAAGRVSPATVHPLVDVLEEVHLLTRMRPVGRPLAVRALLVVPDHEVRAIGPVEIDVRAVAVHDLAGALSRGPIVPMATVTDLFAQLSGHLAPDLHANAV